MRPSHASLARLSSAGTAEVRAKASLGGPAYFTALLDDEFAVLPTVQEDILEQMEGASFEAQDPERFHITLVHIPDITDDELAEVLSDLGGLPAAFAVEMVEATVLDSINGIPVVLRVNPNPALLRLTGDIVRALDARRIAVSTYSRPELYKPHITLALDLEPRTTPPGVLDAPFSLMVREFVVTRNDYQETKRVRLPASVGERVLVTAGPPFQALPPLASRAVARRAEAAGVDLTALAEAIERNTAAVLRIADAPAPEPSHIEVSAQPPDIHADIHVAPARSEVNVDVKPTPVEVQVDAPIVENTVNVEAVRLDGLTEAIERQTQEVLASRSLDAAAIERLNLALAEQAVVLRAATQRESMAEAMAPLVKAFERLSGAVMALAVKPAAPADLHVDFPAYRVTKKVVRDPETHAIDEVVEIFEPE